MSHGGALRETNIGVQVNVTRPSSEVGVDETKISFRSGGTARS